MTDEKRLAGQGAFFGRRKGKTLRAHQTDLIETLLPRLSVDLQSPCDLATLHAKPVQGHVLEIGFGGGEHLVREALAHPHLGFVGVEPFVNGMAKMLAEIERKAIANVRLHPGDGADVLAWLPEASHDIVYLLYPDPWPKSRHHKRRFVSDRTVEALARVLKPGGEFRFASDIDHYSEWTLAHLLRSPHFVFAAERAVDWRTPWAGWESTRYEVKALREGRQPCYLTFRRL
ncbi:tRNA (guanosine(46)-N7)-methyltransferase TrmB [Phreatobacter aquaticus]|uniref:tRNA (guanine-N(7)-)-methyltransferase n=1 Tax=Phreatobacter aquaticus TaxID=2570229 RepID=A0A4D7QM59_9HYPH|nr:tRNA (guanosine(46)-N7)-methyltransferase TrmB [Phreatobacter aquaticus]QCK86404.1 tRNA (guanosine(46)-N7)-methyltransferase TrmB [Phreatobacter aquaticus]